MRRDKTRELSLSSTKLSRVHAGESGSITVLSHHLAADDGHTNHSDRTPAPVVRAPVWFGSDGTADGFSAWELVENRQNMRPLPHEHASPETTRSPNLRLNAQTHTHISMQLQVHYYLRV